MDELIRQAGSDLNIVPSIDVWQMLIVLGLSAVLSAVLAKVYVYTHSGISFSVSNAQTIVFVTVTIAMIMVIIGSNVARAFALVGAMSIVRFRNPVKDPKDIAFLFMAMAIGMAVGTGFYLFSVVFTAFGSFLAVVFHRTGFGGEHGSTSVLRLRMLASQRGPAEEVISSVGSHFKVVAVDRSESSVGFDDYIYEVTFRRGQNFDALMSRLQEEVPEASVSLLLGEGVVDA